MAEAQTNIQKIDPRNGYCSETKIYHSLRPPSPSPPISQPISITEYTFSLLYTSMSSPIATSTLTTPFLIDAATGQQLTYSSFLSQTHSLALSLRSQFPSLSKNDVAFILAPPSLHVPIPYFSLLALGITVSPANPLSTPPELAHLLQLSKPAVVFITSSISQKLPRSSQLNTILLDSPRFLSMINSISTVDTPTSISGGNGSWFKKYRYRFVNQDDTTAILYSSGITGRVKGVELTHQNIIVVLAGAFYNRYVAVGKELTHPVSLFSLPLFYIYGFLVLIRAATAGDTLVLMGRFDFEEMLKAVEKYKVTYIPVSP